MNRKSFLIFIFVYYVLIPLQRKFCCFFFFGCVCLYVFMLNTSLWNYFVWIRPWSFLGLINLRSYFQFFIISNSEYFYSAERMPVCYRFAIPTSVNIYLYTWMKRLDTCVKYLLFGYNIHYLARA